MYLLLASAISADLQQLSFHSTLPLFLSTFAFVSDVLVQREMTSHW